jgi:hypothetical protein
VELLDKKTMKNIDITEVKVNRLNSYQDYSGEYNTNCDVDFILSESITLNVFDKEYVIDRIKMDCRYDEFILEYAQEGKNYCCFPVSKIFVHKVMNRVIEEQQDGVLKGWVFDDSLMEILQGENTLATCFY